MKTVAPIDVIIPCKDGARFLEECLTSVSTQTLKPTMIILVDDHSVDMSVELAIRWAEENPEVPLVVIGSSGHGPSAARNTGIRASASPYLAFLDADDVWAPTKLSRQYELFLESPFRGRLGLVYSDYSVIDEEGLLVPSAKTIHPELNGRAFRKLARGNLISGSASAVMVSRDVIDSSGWFDTRLRSAEDWDMWRRISRIALVTFCSGVEVFIRQHSGQSQSNPKSSAASAIVHFDKWVRSGHFSFHHYIHLVTTNSLEVDRAIFGDEYGAHWITRTLFAKPTVTFALLTLKLRRSLFGKRE